MSAAELRAQLNGAEWQPRCFNLWSAMPVERGIKSNI
jgi:hypothetical protein